MKSPMPRKILMNRKVAAGFIRQGFLLGLSLTAFLVLQAEAQTITLDASKLLPRVELSVSPRAASFAEGSTFDMPILLNTRGHSINAIEVRVNFDRERLEVIKPSSGQSFVGVWIEPPSYDNTRGIASYVGAIPGGITTSAGHVGTITFRAKKIGKATVTFSTNTKVLLNDGQGSAMQVDLGRGEYTILPKAPEGVQVFSETHPFQSEWYNNNSPVLFWENIPGVEGYSFTLDNAPSTIPESEIITSATTQAIKDLGDGLWYFHIKARKNSVWGTTGHFLLRVDTSPPAAFTPKLDYLSSSSDSDERALVSFLTTDNLSGIDHYEVGVLDGSQPATVSPVFIQAESPFQAPLSGGEMNIIVRAVDKAGNIRDVTITAGAPSAIWKFIKEKLPYILLFTFLGAIIALALHYIVSRLIMWYLRRAIEVVRKDERPRGYIQIPPEPEVLPAPRLQRTIRPSKTPKLSRPTGPIHLKEIYEMAKEQETARELENREEELPRLKYPPAEPLGNTFLKPKKLTQHEGPSYYPEV